MLTAAVSGSFHRHMSAITAAVHELAALSVRVLSPSDPRVVAAKGEFLFVASDRHRSVKLVQDRHMDCIKAADFLWLVCPDGYVGLSAAMEINSALDAGVPIYTIVAPSDVTVREYVTVTRNLTEAVDRANANPRQNRPESLLIDPHSSIEEAHAMLERVESALIRQNHFDDPAPRVYRELANLRTKLILPSSVQ
jgi:hypothetical protein